MPLQNKKSVDPMPTPFVSQSPSYQPKDVPNVLKPRDINVINSSVDSTGSFAPHPKEHKMVPCNEGIKAVSQKSLQLTINMLEDKLKRSQQVTKEVEDKNLKLKNSYKCEIDNMTEEIGLLKEGISNTVQAQIGRPS
jgi:hypothetical protein